MSMAQHLLSYFCLLRRSVSPLESRIDRLLSGVLFGGIQPGPSCPSVCCMQCDYRGRGTQEERARMGLKDREPCLVALEYRSLYS